MAGPFVLQTRALRAQRAVAWALAALGVVGAGAAIMATRATGASPLSLVVTASPAGATASDVLVLEGTTYDAAAADVTAAARTSATIPVALPGMPDLSSVSATVTTDATARSVAIQGDTTVLGRSARLLVNANWADAADTDPDVAVLVRFASVGLDTLNPSWTSVPVSFGPAVIGLTDSAHTVTPSSVLGTDTFLADEFADTDDAFPLAAAGVNLSAVVSSGAITDAAAQLGDASTSGLRLRGTLSSSLGVLGGTGSGLGLDLSVDIPVATPSSFPSWVTLSSPWNLRLAADSSGTFAAGFTGGLSVAPDGSSPVDVTGSASVEVVGGATTVTLGAELGPIADLFGQSWLDLNGAALQASIGSGGFAGSIDAGLTLGPVTADVSLDLAVAGGNVNASLDLTATGPVSSTELLTALGASANGIDAELADVTLNQLALYVSVDKPQGQPASVLVSLFGDASITVNNGTFDAAMLFRVEKSGPDTSLLVSGRLGSPSLQDLDPTIPFDWKLPDVALVATNQTNTIPFDELDTPTQAYFTSVLCDGSGVCADLELTPGLVIAAQIELPADLRSQLGDLGVTVDGPIGLTGTLPILGGTELSLEVALPEVLGSDTDLVKSGQVSFRIATDTATRQVEASIDGSMVFRISRPADACDGTEDGTWPATSTCYDELTLSIEASVTASPTTGVEINLAGTISEWDRAFGLDWLTIDTLRLQLGLSAGGGSPVSLTVGMLGQFVIGDATESTDLTLAFKFDVTPTPPWFTLTGLTAASGDGIRLQSVAQTFDPTFDASTLPDLALKRLWFAYGTETDEDLCIRQGLYISAELHLGAAPATGSQPGCIPGTTVPADPADLPTAGCAESNTCLASILIDIQTGPSPSFTGAGFIRGFDVGPIAIDDTSVVLQLGATNQRFYLSGGAQIDDLTGATNDVWASGDVTIDFRNDAGNVQLLVAGNVNVGGDQGVTASLSGTAAADFSAIGSGDLATFFDSLTFDLDYELSIPALDDVGDTIDGGLQKVDQWLDTAGNEITSTFDPNDNADLQSFLTLFEPVGEAPQYAALQGFTGKVGDAAASIQKQSDDYYNYISAYWQLRFYDVFPAGGGQQNAWTYFREQVGIRVGQAVQDAGGVGNIARNGIDRIIILGQDVGAIESIKTFRLQITGICETTPNDPLCGNSLSAAVADSITEPLAGRLFNEQTGYTLPTASAQRVAVAAVLSPPTDNLAAIRELNSAFTAGGVQVLCTTVSVQYSPQGNVQQPAVVTLDALGSTTSVSIDFDPNRPVVPIVPADLVQGSINTILGAEAEPPACEAPSSTIGAGGTSLVVGTPTVDEGAEATVSGIADPASRGSQITITWGDGTTTTATASASDGSWSSVHTYPDDTGAGSATSYVVSARAAGAVDVQYGRVVVTNVAPVMQLQGAAEITLDEGGTVTVRGSYRDAGVLDSHTLIVSWGDGSPDTRVELAAGQEGFLAQHRYVDDDPSGTVVDQKALRVRLVDDDGGEDVEQRTVSVRNVAPRDVSLDGITVGGGPVALDPQGRFVVPEAGQFTVTGSFRDPGVADTHIVSVDWGDGGRGATATVVRDANDPTLMRFTAVHTYTDDAPTATASDLYTISFFIGDDDLAETTQLRSVRVADVAPVVSISPIAATAENVAVQVSASFTDVGTLDTHTATIDWGDGSALESVSISATAGGGTLSASHVYGDNGSYTVTVAVTDDDTVAGTRTATVTIANTAPTVSIDRTGSTTFDGVQTVVGTQNTSTALSGRITDPGSDDVTVTWTFGDGGTDTTPNLVNPPNTDPAQSPSVQPRSFVSGASRSYVRPCVYTARLSATDDDGGAATPDEVTVVVLGSARRWESNGYWKTAYSAGSTLPAADLACFLRIAAHTSGVFGPGDPVALGSSADARMILFKDTGTAIELFDRDLLVAWLNVANGGLPLTTAFDTDGNGVPDATAAQVLARAEQVRLDPRSSRAQIDAARKAVNDLQKFAR